MRLFHFSKITWLQLGTILGVYFGMCLSSYSVALYGGNTVGAGLLVIFFYPFVALFSLVPFSIIYRTIVGYDSDLLDRPFLSSLTYSLITGYVACELWRLFIEKTVNGNSSLDGFFITSIFLVLALLVSYAVVLIVFEVARRKKMLKSAIVIFFVTVITGWIVFNYSESLPHLANVCSSVHVGDPWIKAEEAYAIIQERRGSDPAYAFSKKTGGIFISYAGVFCHFSMMDGAVSRVDLTYDGP